MYVDNFVVESVLFVAVPGKTIVVGTDSTVVVIANVESKVSTNLCSDLGGVIKAISSLLSSLTKTVNSALLSRLIF